MNILIVGAGGIGLKHIRAFNGVEPRPKLCAIDPRRESLERAAELGAEPIDAAWDDIDLSQFGGVVICAPAPFHVPMTARCLREGVPVLSEKPLSHAWSGVEELIELSEQAGAPPSGVAYVRRYHPLHQMAARLIASGELGEMLVCRVNTGQPFTTYRPDYKEIYYARREMGGGCLLDAASHHIDLVQSYMGPIREMTGFIRHLALEGVEVEDAVALSFDFSRNGALGTMNTNQFQPNNEGIIEFAGTDGFLRIVEPGFTCRIFRKGAADWEDLEVEQADYLEAMRRQAQAFVAAIDGGPPLLTSIRDAAHTLRLCLKLISKE